ncbi:MAG: hypothetical protein KIT84_08675 [Labilithrix sp.]|nr:hypothetical protein [Labilithrix sp.]
MTGERAGYERIVAGVRTSYRRRAGLAGGRPSQLLDVALDVAMDRIRMPGELTIEGGETLCCLGTVRIHFGVDRVDLRAKLRTDRRERREHVFGRRVRHRLDSVRALVTARKILPRRFFNDSLNMTRVSTTCVKNHRWTRVFRAEVGPPCLATLEESGSSVLFWSSAM